MAEISSIIPKGRYCGRWLDADTAIECAFLNDGEGGIECKNPELEDVFSSDEDHLELDQGDEYTGNILRPKDCIALYGEEES